KRSSTCIKRTAGNGRMDDGLNCGRNVPGSTRQTNALSFYSLGNEVDKGRSRTASLIYKSIVIGSTDKFGTTILTHLFCPHFGGKSSTEHHSASGFPPRSDEKIYANLADLILSVIPKNCTRKKTCH
ncbi:hypothetical protein, partial [uncultured Selenomonas sp.]|uniref:hypothetical protein n=1 Tax=uncultured Selenomonas sp. TaxID=159275 RepID=UPI0028F09E02